jgi:hypothetical protein
MSAKTVVRAMLMGAWLCCATLHAQEPTNELPTPRYDGSLIPANPALEQPAGPLASFGVPMPGGAPGSPSAGPPGTAANGVLPTNTGLSDWILYRRDAGPIWGATGGKPMMVEIFARTGISVPVGGTLLGRELDTGWRLEVGGRTLWFDQTFKKAWVIEANLVNTYNGAIGVQQVPLGVFVTDVTVGSTSPPAKFVQFGQGGIPGVTIRGVNRTMLGLGIGREYYLWKSANTPGTHWRIGWDGGGRYGSMKMDLNEIKHRTRVLENGYLSAHSDLELNCGHWIWYSGFRFEWDYTANTILQRQSDFQDLNMLLTGGVRW